MTRSLPEIIERSIISAPLGLRFHDAATGEIVSGGLQVTARPVSDRARGRETVLIANRAGVYVLHRAAGLEDFERGAGKEKFWLENPSGKSFIVEVFDLERRFQKIQFEVELPSRGVYRWNAEVSSPPANASAPSVPLYSAATRKIAGGQAVVRAELWDAEQNAAAAFAVLEASFSNRLVARGIAGKDGKIALVFPELAPVNQPAGSPPTAANKTPLGEQTWNLRFAVKYELAATINSPALELVNEAPDLRRALAQRRGRIWANQAQTEEFAEAALRFGAELVLRTGAPTISSPDFSGSSADLNGKLFVSAAD